MDTRCQVIHGDSREVLKTLAENSVDSAVTDPPYALVSIVKRFGKPNAAPAKGNDAYIRASSGFMGQAWDTGETAFDPDFWREVLRVLKPGAHLVAFSGTRTYHRMACAIEDAGFEIRDRIEFDHETEMEYALFEQSLDDEQRRQFGKLFRERSGGSLAWKYGAGFPKSHNPRKSAGANVCRCAPVREHDMRLVPGADLPTPLNSQDQRREVLLEGLPEQGASAAMLWAEPEESASTREKPRMEGRCDIPQAPRELCERSICEVSAGDHRDGQNGRLRDGTSASHGPHVRLRYDADGVREPQGSQPAEQSYEQLGTVAHKRRPQTGRGWQICGRCSKPIIPEGLGTALKPACEPIVLARKPLSEKTVAANVLRWGTGALNIDGCRVAVSDSDVRDVGREITRNVRAGEEWGMNSSAPQSGVTVVRPEGRWPANVIHDGSDEVVALFPNADGAVSNGRKGVAGIYDDGVGQAAQMPSYADTGSAARFFYTAKADAEDRLGSKHPTVKPVDLMQWLVRLVTPPKGCVLDCFAGTGTTGEATFREGMRSILIEREERFVADIHRRVELMAAGPFERAGKIAKQESPHSLPLFSEVA
jgi:DNA modification methylase